MDNNYFFVLSVAAIIAVDKKLRTEANLKPS